MTEITEKEWNETTSTLQKDTAPGISGIGYKLIKNINIESQKYLIDFANKIITNGNFPKKWKLGQIYLIPKNVNWEHNLASTRPIMLLETFRKLVVRIIQKRLCKVISQKNILKGANFAGLPGESTIASIYILNNVIEDAKQRNHNL